MISQDNYETHLRQRCEALADEVMKLRSDRDKWEHRCSELAEERNLWKERADAAQTKAAILEGAARRIHGEWVASRPINAALWGALGFALAEVAKGAGR